MKIILKKEIKYQNKKCYKKVYQGQFNIIKYLKVENDIKLNRCRKIYVKSSKMVN